MDSDYSPLTMTTGKKTLQSKFWIGLLCILVIILILYTQDWNPNKVYTIIYLQNVYKNLSFTMDDLWATEGGNNSELEDENSIENSTTKFILDWTGFFGDKLEDKGWLSECPAYNCKVTNDRSQLDKADAVAFHMRNFLLNDLPKSRRPEQYFLFYLLESPLHTHVNLFAIQAYFNVTATFRRDSDFYFPYGNIHPRREPIDTTLMKQNISQKVEKKKKLIAWFVSNCYTPSKREQYVEVLKKHIQVDVYGNCGSSCPHGPGCDKLLEDDYKFYLSFENSLCMDYVTEKFFTRMSQLVLPIILSRKYYQNVDLPPKSVIAADEFCSVEDLANYLKYLDKNTTAYLEYFEWKLKYQARDDYTCADVRNCAFCGLCRMLHKSVKPRRILDDVQKWWYDDAHCDNNLVPTLLEKRGKTANLLLNKRLCYTDKSAHLL